VVVNLNNLGLAVTFQNVQMAFCPH